MGSGRRKLGAWWAIYMGSRLARLGERAWMWLAWHLPRGLVRWAAVRLMSHATTGTWSKQVVGDLTAIDALKRWDER